MLTSVPMALGPEWLHPQTMIQDFGGAAVWATAGVIFAECGLLLGFFLPGDSLLFTIGLFIGSNNPATHIDFPLALACAVLSLAAFIGNVVGYQIGRTTGPAIFNRPNSRLLKQDYVDKTMDFFEKYGGRAIIMARFVPIVRTFITVTAGVGRMDRRRYYTYSAIGAVLWASGVTILGRLLGNVSIIADHIEVALILVVLVSVIPMIVEGLRHRAAARRSAIAAGAAASGTGTGAGRHVS